MKCFFEPAKTCSRVTVLDNMDLTEGMSFCAVCQMNQVKQVLYLLAGSEVPDLDLEDIEK